MLVVVGGCGTTRSSNSSVCTSSRVSRGRKGGPAKNTTGPTLSLKLFDPEPLATDLPTGRCQGHEALENLNSHDTACSLVPLKAAEKKVLSSHGRHARDQEGLYKGSMGRASISVHQEYTGLRRLKFLCKGQGMGILNSLIVRSGPCFFNPSIGDS